MVDLFKHISSSSLFYDVIPYTNPLSFDPADAEPAKYTVILFSIKQYEHTPIVSFCYEDIMSTPPDEIMQNVEIYSTGISLKRDVLDIHVYLPETREFYGTILTFNEKKTFILNAEFENIIRCQCDLTSEDKDNRCPVIIRTKFNNPEYIDRSLPDKVEALNYTLGQVVKQVKKITDHLKA